jgi:hypothetical protein
MLEGTRITNDDELEHICIRHCNSIIIEHDILILVNASALLVRFNLSHGFGLGVVSELSWY